MSKYSEMNECEFLTRLQFEFYYLDALQVSLDMVCARPLSKRKRKKKRKRKESPTFFFDQGQMISITEFSFQEE